MLDATCYMPYATYYIPYSICRIPDTIYHIPYSMQYIRAPGRGHLCTGLAVRADRAGGPQQGACLSHILRLMVILVLVVTCIGYLDIHIHIHILCYAILNCTVLYMPLYIVLIQIQYNTVLYYEILY